MGFASKRKSSLGEPGIAFPVRTICVLAAVAATAAGCASPLYRTHPDLSPRKSTIRNAGLLPPAIAMYEEQYRFKLVPREEWSREATDAVRKAFIEEMTAAGFPVAAIDGGDRELSEAADLFGAVDFSIGRHVYEDALKETFPEKVRVFDYSLGAAGETMERHRVDAVWFVTGTNLLPTVGTQIADAIEVLMAIAGGIGRVPTFSSSLMKLEFRAALVDKSGTVLFYCRVSETDLWQAAQDRDRVDPSRTREGPVPEGDDAFVRDDIRDPRIARRCVRALISEFRKATVP
jgi:hypothetical protein